jgi:(1->4)-alpha-D-glucan 1-alpha-D-glucosylmutase
VRAFHGASLDRAKHWPHTLIATSTHDNKRSEDVRARIDVLSEMPAAWRLALRRWSRMNRNRKQMVNDELAPSRNDEYLLYQTLIGSLPLHDLEGEALTRYRERIEAYMLKAVREAKVHTSWINIDEGYEAATVGFVHALLASERNPFLDSLRAVAAPIAWVGMLNSLSMVLIKLTSPGVPDIYQGSELWDLSLVDPDNRRPVDYAQRAALLRDLERAELHNGADVRALFATPEDGRPKRFLTQRALALRAKHPHLFLQGGYTAINAQGLRADHVVAYARRHAGAGIIVIAARMFSRLVDGPGDLPCGEPVWRDTSIEVPFLSAGAQLDNWLTGQRLRVTDGRVRVADALVDFPGAILVCADGDSAPESATRAS